MSHETRLSDLVADELLLDQVAARSDSGNDPVALLLTAIARHADAPLRPVPVPGRYRRHRALTALTALVVGASGAGVAAAVNGPADWLGRPSPHSAVLDADRPRTLTSPRLPQAPVLSGPAPVLAGDGYTLVRDAAGRIVLLPPTVVVDQPDAGPAALAPAEEVLAAGAGPDVAEGGGQAEVASMDSGSTSSRADKPSPAALDAAEPVKVDRTTTKPGKAKSLGPIDPGTDPGTDPSASLTLASVPDPEPSGLAIAAARRPSTPGTESGPGVPADPQQGPRPQTPADASGPAHPAHPEHPETPAKPDGPEKPDTGKPDPAPPGQADPGQADPGQADPGLPDPGPLAEPGSQIPAVPDVSKPDRPAEPGAGSPSERPSPPEAPASEVPSEPKPASPARPETPAPPETPARPETPATDREDSSSAASSAACKQRAAVPATIPLTDAPSAAVPVEPPAASAP